MQLIANSIARADASEVDADDFTAVNAVQVDQLQVRLGEMLRGMSDPHLRTLAECFLMDEALMAKLSSAPAGIKNHHAYRGGLLEHIVTLMEIVLRLGPIYPQLDLDLLLMGAFLHDLGKVDELSYDREFAYTDEGQLVGHLVMVVGLLERQVGRGREAQRRSGAAARPCCG